MTGLLLPFHSFLAIQCINLSFPSNSRRDLCGSRGFLLPILTLPVPRIHARPRGPEQGAFVLRGELVFLTHSSSPRRGTKCHRRPSQLQPVPFQPVLSSERMNLISFAYLILIRLLLPMNYLRHPPQIFLKIT